MTALTLTPDAVAEASAAAEQLLLDLIRLPSLSGREQQVAAFLEEAFTPWVDRVERVPLSNDLRTDPEYSDVIPDLEYRDRHNLRLRIDGVDAGPTLLVNTHMDVVPASTGQTRAFDPYVEDDVVYGRGACDAKGQIACLYLALRLLRQTGARPRGPVLVHLVVEEENGGNGTLAMIRTADRADAAIVLEPSGGQIVPSVRGAVWFRVTCTGRAAHSGSHEQAVSALKSAIEAMTAIERFHAALIERSRGLPLFDAFANPMPLTFGRLHAGNWPASAPDEAQLEGVMGFLPNTTREEVMAGLRAALHGDGSTWLSQHHTLTFMYRHESHVLPPQHGLVERMQQACRDAGVTPHLAAFPASCDSWFYNNLCAIPTVVYGPGHLAVAHSAREQIAVPALRDSARVLAALMMRGI